MSRLLLKLLPFCLLAAICAASAPISGRSGPDRGPERGRDRRRPRAGPCRRRVAVHGHGGAAAAAPRVTCSRCATRRCTRPSPPVRSHITVTYVGGPAPQTQTVILPWTIIDSAAAARAFADRLESAPISRAHDVDLGGAEILKDLLDASGVKGLRRVIDVSGDGPNNSGLPITGIRDELVASGIVINGLPIVLKGRAFGMFDLEDLDRYYADCVIGGTGAFASPCASWANSRPPRGASCCSRSQDWRRRLALFGRKAPRPAIARSANGNGAAISTVCRISSRLLAAALNSMIRAGFTLRPPRFELGKVIQSKRPCSGANRRRKARVDDSPGRGVVNVALSTRAASNYSMHHFRLCIALLVAALALWGCSQQPRFVAQEEPWRDETRSAPAWPQAWCARPASSRRAPPLADPSVCGALHPFSVSATANGWVQMKPAALLRCTMIPAVDQWVQRVVIPAARYHFGVPVVEG